MAVDKKSGKELTYTITEYDDLGNLRYFGGFTPFGDVRFFYADLLTPETTKEIITFSSKYQANKVRKKIIAVLDLEDSWCKPKVATYYKELFKTE